MQSPSPQLSRIRTFLFWALAFVWFSEMVFHGPQSISKIWADLWLVTPPENPQLASALYLVWAVVTPSKGALFVLAVFALRSKNPWVRTALFVSMALVPPLNIAFPMRQQGFPLGPVTVATVFSLILWGTFIFFRESAGGPSQQLLDLLKAHPVGFKWFSFVQGLESIPSRVPGTDADTRPAV